MEFPALHVLARPSTGSVIIRRMSDSGPYASMPPAGNPTEGGTWNTPEAIAEHRAMTPEQRFLKAIEVSRAALRFARAGRGRA